MSQDPPPRSSHRTGIYPTDVPPGIRGLKSKQGILGMALVLVPGVILVTLGVETLAGVPYQGISSLNLGRGIGSSGLMLFYGYLCLKTAITGEDYKGQREKVKRDEAELLRQQHWHEGKKARKHPHAPSRDAR